MKCLIQRRSEVSIPIRFIIVPTVFKTGSEAVLITPAKRRYSDLNRNAVIGRLLED